MINRLIKIEELQEGDEIIISGNSSLKYLKVLKNPEFKDGRLWQRSIDPITNILTWGYNEAKIIKTVRCSIRQDCIACKTESGKDTFIKNYVFEQDVSKHNHRISINLNGRHIYLVKREQPKNKVFYE